MSNIVFATLEALITRNLVKFTGQVSTIDRFCLAGLQEKWDLCDEIQRARWLASSKAIDTTLADEAAVAKDDPAFLGRATHAVSNLLRCPVLEGKGYDLAGLMSMGDKLWHLLPQFSGGDTDLAFAISQIIGTKVADASAHAQNVALYRWTDGGFPTVKISAAFAAAAMTTVPNREVLEELKYPWKSFIIDMPREPVLYMFSKNVPHPVTHINVLCYEIEPSGEYRWTLMIGSQETEVVLQSLNRPAITLGSLPDGTGSEMAFEAPWDDASGRNEKCLMLAGRLVVSVICALTNPRSVGKVNQAVHDRWGNKTRRRQEDPSELRTYQITAPITINLVEHVTEYQLRHKSNWSLSLRHTVAGHWKLQPYGPGHAERRPTWIHPYWRGPGDAPVALRTHNIKP